MGLHELLSVETKVLVVDDVASARAVLRAALGALGYQNVIEACDGREAWAKLSTDREIGLVVSDWQMPNMDGIELAALAVESEISCKVPLIIVTSKSEWEDMAQATFVGVWGYVVKPITAASLAVELEEVLKEANDWESASEEADEQP